MNQQILKTIKDLRTFIELSHMNEERPWEEWISATVQEIKTSCWEKKQCRNFTCPAYLNKCGRCWLIAGTMCGNCVEGTFAKKYETCCTCEVFKELVVRDPATELRELLIILIHSLRSQHHELKDAMGRIKVLSGLLPVCASCKKIRDEKGMWKQMETYISEHSEADFTHGFCPDCAKKTLQEFEKLKNKD